MFLDNIVYTKKILGTEINKKEYLLKIYQESIYHERSLKLNRRINIKPRVSSKKTTILTFDSKYKLYDAIIDNLIKSNNIEFRLKNVIDETQNTVELVLKDGMISVDALTYNYIDNKNIFDLKRNTKKVKEHVKEIKLRINSIKDCLENNKDEYIEFNNYFIGKVKEYKGINVDINLPIITYSDILTQLSFDRTKYELIKEMQREVKEGEFIFDKEKFDDLFFILDNIKYSYYRQPRDIKPLINKYKTIIFKYIKPSNKIYIDYNLLDEYEKGTIVFQNTDYISNSNIKNQMYKIREENFDGSYVTNKITVFEYDENLIICFYSVKESIMEKLKLYKDPINVENLIKMEIDKEKKQLIKEKQITEEKEKKYAIQFVEKLNNSYTLRQDYDTDIFYFIDYEPKYIHQHHKYNEKIYNIHFKEKDQEILDLKNNMNSAVKYFYERIIWPLVSWKEINKNISITIVPSHKVGNSSPGMTNLVENLCNTLGCEDKVGILERYKDIEKLSLGGNRKKYVHYNSIKVSGKASNKRILILDDVTTTGNSLLACKDLLENEGYEVICLSISKTKSYW